MTDLVRVSEGTGALLGLWERRMEALPTTAYLMTYSEGRCAANCRFCPQARESESDLEKLSRVSWPEVELEEVLESLGSDMEVLERVCVQTTNRPGILEDLFKIVRGLDGASDLPVSVSCHPLTGEEVDRLSCAGVERISFPLDASTPDIFDSVKGRATGGPYSWREHMRALESATSSLDGRVTTHLIVGLGETEREAVELIQRLEDMGVTVGLFAFTPIPGTPLEGRDQPPIGKYRRVQLARHIIANDLATYSEMDFEGGEISGFGVDDGEVLEEAGSGEPFRTSGCPGCNRPYYNESPRGPIYNFPREPTDPELERVFKQLDLEVGSGD